MEEEQTKKTKIIQKKILLIVLITFLSLLLIYLVLSVYFIRHFYWGTTIGELRVGGQSVTKVEETLMNEMNSYVLTLQERGNESEEITGKDIDISFSFREQLEEIKKKQNGFAWLFKLGSDQTYTLDKTYTYDEAKLKTVMNNLTCLDKAHQKKPEDASVVYEKDSFVIKAGDKGNLIDKKSLLKSLKEAIGNAESEVDLEEAKCYKEAKYQVDSKEIIALKDELNNYLKSEITYQIGKNTETISADLIKDWLIIDENMKAKLVRSNVEQYVSDLSSKYNTIGTTRNFNTSSGTTVQVSGGDYGWEIDEERETHELAKALQSYKAVTRTPICTQEGVAYDATNDIGGTYVEINLSSQYLWLYGDGKLITEGSIVSGTADGRHNTPAGVYKIDYMERNAVLRGPGYACPVSFWMPFNGDIGLHDATWRGSFGGNIYLYNGSHGCINCPYSLVETIFNTVDKGTPVVCYH